MDEEKEEVNSVLPKKMDKDTVIFVLLGVIVLLMALALYMQWRYNELVVVANEIVENCKNVKFFI